MIKRVKLNTSKDDGRIKDQESWAEVEKEVRDLKLTAKKEKEIDNQAVTQFHRSACLQARDSIGQVTLDSLFRVAFLYGQLNPQDGVDAALARVIPTLTEATMECFRRASVAEALPLRDSELNYALKGDAGPYRVDEGSR